MMPNDAKLGLVVGVGTVLLIAALFFRKDVAAPAAQTPPIAPTSPANAPERKVEPRQSEPRLPEPKLPDPEPQLPPPTPVTPMVPELPPPTIPELPPPTLPELPPPPIPK